MKETNDEVLIKRGFIASEKGNIITEVKIMSVKTYPEPNELYWIL